MTRQFLFNNLTQQSMNLSNKKIEQTRAIFLTKMRKDFFGQEKKSLTLLQFPNILFSLSGFFHKVYFKK